MSGKRLMMQAAFHGQGHERVKVSTGPGGRIHVGDDGALSVAPSGKASHFDLTWDGEHCEIHFSTDIPPPQIHGRPAVVGERIPSGGWIRSGSGDWLVHEEDLSFECAEQDVEPEVDAVCARLEGSVGSLYAVVDVTCLPRVRSLLNESVERCGSLFSGPNADRMPDAAPQLVLFERRSGLLRRLVHRGWRTRWGVFVHSALSMCELRLRLREVLFLRPSGGGQTLLFRFYDPLILAQYAEARRRRPCPALFSGLSMRWIDGEGRLRELREDDA